MSSNKTVAFFGATGDCAGYCLASTLKAGYVCTAMARTPSKLTGSMKSKGVSDELLDAHLSIIQGDARDTSTIRSTLLHNGKLVDVIVSGMGGTPAMQWSLSRPVILTDRTLCQDFGRILLQVCTELCREDPTATKPFLVNLSTTGIPAPGMPRDVPLLYVPFYHWFLMDPHEDKLVFQDQLAEHAQLPETERGISAHVNTKASLLLDGPGKGIGKVREGVEDKPAVGYTIQRKDVGEWIFQKLVHGEPKAEWKNKSVTLTY